jgi:TrwC relaxase
MPRPGDLATREPATDRRSIWSGHGQSPGHWYGAGATTMGLQDEASPAAFRRMFEGGHPDTGSSGLRAPALADPHARPSRAGQLRPAWLCGLPRERSATPTHTHAAPRLAPHQPRSAVLPNRGHVVLRVAWRGMVSGRLLARRWPRTNMAQIAARRIRGLSLWQASCRNCVQAPIPTVNLAATTVEPASQQFDRNRERPGTGLPSHPTADRSPMQFSTHSPPHLPRSTMRTPLDTWSRRLEVVLTDR